jgi:hypothetical protein
MKVTVEDYVRVDERVKELGCSFPTGLAIVPIRFESATSLTDLRTASHTETVLKFFKSEGIPVGSFLPESNALPYIVNKHFEWLGPILFVPLALMNENPQLVSLAIGVLSNCITDFFKGIPKSQRNVRLDIVVETESDRIYKKISYDGGIDGLNALPKIIRETMK